MTLEPTSAGYVRNTKAVWMAIGAAYLLAVAHGFRYLHANIDDQYMLYHYAANLARGDGFTFGGGQRVEGFSSFLYVVMLAPIFSLLGVLKQPLNSAEVMRMVVASKTAGILCAAGTMAYLGTLARRAFRFPAPLVFACLVPLALSVDFVYSATNGMETSLVMLLYSGMVCHAVFACLAQHSPATNWKLSVVFACLLMLARVDGFVPVGSLWLGCVIVRLATCPRRKWPSSASLAGFLAAVLAVGGAYELFRLAYFHSLFPNTFYVKFPVLGWSERIEVRDFWNWKPEVIRSWQRIPRALQWYVIPATWGYFALYVFLLSYMRLAQSHLRLAAYRTFYYEAEGAAGSRLQAVLIVMLSALPPMLYVLCIGGDWMPGHRILMHVMPVGMTVGAGMGIHWIACHSRELRAGVIPVGITLCALVFGTAFTAEYVRDRYVYAAMLEFGQGGRIDHGHQFHALRAGLSSPSNFTMYAQFMDELARNLVPGDTVAFYESGYASLAMPAGVRLIDLSGLNDTRLGRPGPGEVYTPEMARTYVTCGDSGGGKGAFIVAQHPKFIVFDTFQLRWCKRFPDTLFDGQYKYLPSVRHNSINFFSVFAPPANYSSMPAVPPNGPQIDCGACK